MGIGDFVKVVLQGECPWVEVLEIDGDLIRGRIDNKLFHEYSEFEKARILRDAFGSVTPVPELHHYKIGDVLWFEFRQDIEGFVPVVTKEPEE